MDLRLLPWLVLLAPLCLSGSMQGIGTNTSPEHLNPPTISNVSTTGSMQGIGTNTSPEHLNPPTISNVSTTGSMQGIGTNTSPEHLNPPTISNVSTTAKTMTANHTTPKPVKTTAQPEVTSKIPATTTKTVPAAPSTVASPTDKPIPPASTKHSPTESGTHKSTAVPVTKPSPALVTEVSAIQGNSSGFSAGSFIGGIVLTLGILAFGYIGCRFYRTKRGVQYRTIDEHDAII